MASTVPATGASDTPAAAVDGGTLPADCALTVHAVLPPPVTGMTASTEAIVTALSRVVPVRRFNWSNGSATITTWFRVVKFLRAVTSPFRLLFSRRPSHGVFYMPVNGYKAAYYNLWTVGAARLRGYRCAQHHHFYGYLNRWDWRIQLLDRLLGPNGLHVVLCCDMENRLRHLYHCKAGIAIVPSTVQLLGANLAPESASSPVVTADGPFRLGHISNLQLAKGLDVVIEVLRVLRRRGRNVQLVLAGPLQSDVERRLLDEAQSEFGDSLDYRGPVYGQAKQQFFQDIHVKLFPTRYPDAQPLVVTESFAFSRPVIAIGRGCIPAMIASAGDWSVPIDEDFVARAVRQIEHWIDDPESYGNACRAARRRYETMIAAAVQALEDFGNWVCRKPDRGFVHRGPSGAANES